MPTPDSLVAGHGQSMALSSITTPAYNGAGTFDEKTSTVATTTFLAIPSQPRSRELPLQLQGQEMLRLTVPSSLNVQAERPGRPDRVTWNGALYEVLEVRDDKHPMTGVRKKTVLLARVAHPQPA